jgi:hypothetical protein
MDLGQETLFLIARYLRECTPCQDAASALESDLVCVCASKLGVAFIARVMQAAHGLLGTRLTWQGVRQPRSLTLVRSQFPNVPSNRLYTLLHRQSAANNGTLLVDSLLRPAAQDLKLDAQAERQRAPSAAVLANTRTTMLSPLRRPRMALTSVEPALASAFVLSKSKRSARQQLAAGVLPDVCRERLRPVAHVSGHRWLPVCCIQFDPSCRVFVTGGDDKYGIRVLCVQTLYALAIFSIREHTVFYLLLSLC